jgi:hypothetical protein
VPFIAYLSQTLNKNNKQQQHTSLRLPRLSALRRPRTHQHPELNPNHQPNPRPTHQEAQSAYKVCAFLLNKMLASTIQLSTPAHLSAPASPHNPIQCSYRAPSGEGGKRQPLNLCCVIPQGPTVCQDQPSLPVIRFHAHTEV